MSLQNLPKDILIKLITTIGKSYSTYIVIHWDRNRYVEYDSFDTEAELREFLLEIVEEKNMTTKELIKEAEFIMRHERIEPFCVIKGQILTDD